ncbi:hypothetical protein [Burkholderia ubonensis]|uniref:hypothetical protein n=1 Tax=Burkholderia ubonensis TaxID=101571 RepID=UPI000B103244|nr:hypothetical protein [Burkholderia ubonensis]
MADHPNKRWPLLPKINLQNACFFLQIARQNAKKNTEMKLSTRNDKISSSPGHIWTTRRLAIDRNFQVSFASLAWLALAFSANNSASFGWGIFEIVRRQVASYPRAVRAETGDGGDRDAIAADRGRDGSRARAARRVLRRDATPRPTSSAAATARYRIPYIGH